MDGGIQSAPLAPIEIELADGNTYRLTKIGLDAWCDFCTWINRQLGRNLGEAVGLDEMLRHATTLQGMRWMLHRSLITHQPEVALETVGLLFGSMDAMTVAFETVADLPEQDQDADVGSDPPKQPSPE